MYDPSKDDIRLLVSLGMFGILISVVVNKNFFITLQDVCHKAALVPIMLLTSSKALVKFIL